MSRKKRPGPPITIHVISDSTANLLRHMLTAFLTQFPPDAVRVRYSTFVRTPDDLDRAFASIADHPGPVVHGVLSQQVKKAINRRCESLGLGCQDLTGPTVSFLAKESGIKPQIDPGGLHRVDENYEKRIEAMDFTLNHDDGLGLATLAEASVVLAGVSRVSKTPTSILLAQQGQKAANVALAMEVEPPGQLLAMPPKKVVGLLIDPVQLAEIRSRRQGAWNMGTTSYNDRRHVEQEVAWSRRLFSRMGWRTLDITDQAVEETTARILQMLQDG